MVCTDLTAVCLYFGTGFKNTQRAREGALRWYPNCVGPSLSETNRGKAERQASSPSMSTGSLQTQWDLRWMETVKVSKPGC